MTRLSKLLLIVFTCSLFLCICSCNSKDDNHNYSRLRIAVDSSANFYIDSIRLFSDFAYSGWHFMEYDTTVGGLVYVFDSVVNSPLDITLVSFLDRNYTKSVSIKSDTTIFISHNELNNFEKEITGTLPVINDFDTIVIGFSSLGCFHSLNESVVISKQTDKYVVEFNTTRGSSYGYAPINFQKVFDSSFDARIRNFYEDCKALIRRNNFCGSTTSSFIFIRVGNAVYRLPDIGCGDWDGYNKLINAIDPPWPKEKKKI